tara:strand:+ start:18741 stop:21344 length:2604 start_codon:yes stop_codon:yes gene_type:complete
MAEDAKSAKQLKELSKLLKEINREQTDYRDILQDNEALLDAILEASSRRAKKKQEQAAVELANLKKQQQELINLKKPTDEQIAMEDELNKKIAEKTQALVDNEVAIKENTKATKKQNAAIKTTLARVKGMVDVYGRHEEVNADMIFRFKALMDTLGSVRGSLALTGIIAASFFDTMVNLAFMIDETSSSLMRQTGINRDMADSVAMSQRETARLGVTLEQQGEAFQSLFSTYTDFTLQNKATQLELTKTTAVLGQLGISTGDVSTGLQNTTKFFGQTGEAAAATARDLADFGSIIGVTPQKMAADFAGIGDSIAKLGSDGPRAFKDLAIAAKITGIEVNRLVQITDKFDTFEGAATQAGKLNAALGGNFVNAMDLMMATDPLERFEMLREGIMETGLTFDDMSYYQRKFFTEAAGLSDVGELAKLMSGDLNDLAGATQMSSSEYSKLAERTKSVQSVQEKMKATLQSVMIASEPLVDLFREFAVALEKNEDIIKMFAESVKFLVETTFIPMMKFFAEFPKTALASAAAIGMFGGALKGAVANFIGSKLGGGGSGGTLFGKIFGKFANSSITDAAVGNVAGGFETMSSAATGLAENGEDASSAIESMGEASREAAGSLKSMVGPILAIGASVAMASFGVSFLVKAFSELEGGQIAGAVLGIIALGGALALFAKFALVATVPAAGLATSILAVGAAVGLAAFGISFMVESFKGLETSLGSFVGFAVVLVVFTKGAIALGAAGAAASGGILVLAGALAFLAFSFASLGDEMQPFNTFVTGLAKLTENVSNLTLVKTEVEAIAKAMAKVPSAAGMSINTMAAGASNFSAAPTSISFQPEQTINLEIDGVQFKTYVKNVIGEGVQEYMRKQK